MTLCENGVPEVSVAVSVHATEVATNGGQIASQPAPNDFQGAAIPQGGTVPVTPEEAVQLAVKATGRRVTEVPELILPPVPYSGQLARWRLTFDGPVKFHGVHSGQHQTSQQLLAGFGTTVHTHAIGSNDPSVAPRTSINVGTGATQLVTKPDYPATFEAVVIDPR